ncbi:hypothetical protein QYF36_019600 [Acer negundo]|nr:hypothetical protein QYF36_019600 [Acer negundo]
MEPKTCLFFFALFFYLIISSHANILKTYLVQLHPHGTTSSLFTSKLHWHLSFIQKTLSSPEDPSSRLLYSYHSALEGFAAQLSLSELESLKRLPDVIAIRPDTSFQIQTTYSYKFLGLNPTNEGAWYSSHFGRGTIIGVLDTEKELKLVYITGGGDSGSEFCLRGSLPRDKVKGKMVVCDRGVNGRAEKGQAVKEAGGAAMILANTEINMEEDSVDVHVLPASLVGFEESVRLKAYINSTRSARARIIFGDDMGAFKQQSLQGSKSYFRDLEVKPFLILRRLLCPAEIS